MNSACRWRLRRAGGVLSLTCGLAVVLLGSCAEQAQRRSPWQEALDPRVRVAALGNLVVGKPPSELEVQLTSFFFGAEPDASLALIKPMDLAVEPGALLICDGAMQALLKWRPATQALEGVPLQDVSTAAGPIAIGAGGDYLLADASGLRRISAAGATRAFFRLPEGAGALRVGGVAAVGAEVWATNLAEHRVEIFDGESGAHQRSLGRRGRGRGEFGLPLGIAFAFDEVFIVDMLNARLQVFDRDGEWLRDIGGPGDRAGRFGRPRSVAVGPDQTVFVTDAASQRVHAFERGGRLITTFGGPADAENALVLPAGIAIWTETLDAQRPLPTGFAPAYYVLVSEQIVRPGVRAYAWRAPPEPAPSAGPSLQGRPASVRNPHWVASGCDACHQVEAGRVQSIPERMVDNLCLSCHDGSKAVAESHSVGRMALTAHTTAPADLPLHDGRVVCLTCHDIQRHCDPRAVRPVVNPALVRGFHPDNPLASCTQCHNAETWRANPHRGMVAGMNSATAACGFCHVAPPPTAVVEGRIDPALKDAASQLCLNCHVMHPDPAPEGHLGAAVTGRYRAQMQIREAAAAGADRPRLPLEGDRITCATCHNPHPPHPAYEEYFTMPGALQRSIAPADAGKALRLENTELCQYCHPK